MRNPGHGLCTDPSRALTRVPSSMQPDQLYGTSSLAVGTERAARRGNVQVLGGGSLWDTKYPASLLLSCDTFASPDLVAQTAGAQIAGPKNIPPDDSREKLPIESPTYPLSPNRL